MQESKLPGSKSSYSASGNNVYCRVHASHWLSNCSPTEVVKPVSISLGVNTVNLPSTMIAMDERWLFTSISQDIEDQVHQSAMASQVVPFDNLRPLGVTWQLSWRGAALAPRLGHLRGLTIGPLLLGYWTCKVDRSRNELVWLGQLTRAENLLMGRDQCQEGKKAEADSVRKISVEPGLCVHAKVRNISDSEDWNLVPSRSDYNAKHNAESDTNPIRTGYTYANMSQSQQKDFQVSFVPNGMDHLLLLMSFPKVNGHQIKLFHEGLAPTMDKMKCISLMEPALPDDTP
ncbi:hypothetical protein CR513_08061, partial [Mucuna pruriens]